jgi:hypothetical protein
MWIRWIRIRIRIRIRNTEGLSYSSPLQVLTHTTNETPKSFGTDQTNIRDLLFSFPRYIPGIGGDGS